MQSLLIFRMLVWFEQAHCLVFTSYSVSCTEAILTRLLLPLRSLLRQGLCLTYFYALCGIFSLVLNNLLR